MSSVEIVDLNSYNSFIQEKSSLCVVIFYAVWHEPSVQIKNLVKSFQSDFPNVKFATADAEGPNVEEIFEQKNLVINSVPTIIFFHNQKVLDKYEAADPLSILNKIRANIQNVQNINNNNNNNNSVIDTSSQESINQGLSKLINLGSVMIFIKGSPSAPRCGFSRQLLEILNSLNIKYSYFDILSDNVVRENLKKYSNWPTYPQVYVSGELVGGLDVIKELNSNGEFLAMIPDNALPSKSDNNDNKGDSLEARLKKLIESNKIMLFMKGSKESPQCGFSNKAVSLLNEYKVDYGTFDILADSEVREGLKKYSNWPTYPQLYVKGELVGGIDLMTELHQQGELKDQLTN